MSNLYGGRQRIRILGRVLRSERHSDAGARRRIVGSVLGAVAAAALLGGCVFGSATVTLRPDHALAVQVPASNTLTEAPAGGAGPMGLPTPAGVSTGRRADDRPAIPEPPVDCVVLRCVALTFDDGPVPDTRRLLDILAGAGVPATFFDVGEMAHSYPDLVRAEAAQGEVGDHSWSHPELTGLTDSQITWEIGHTATELAHDDGVSPVLARPPYGAQNSRVNSDLAALGQAIVMWSVDTLDWLHRDPDSVYQRAVDGVRPGSIVLMHDIRPTTISAVPRIIAELARRGYRFVTVTQLFGGSLKPGETYFGREQDWVDRHSSPEFSTASENGPSIVDCRVSFGEGC